jgi:hypothetical protein
MQDNRRQNERIPVSLEIVSDFSSGKREARISDLSMSGCFIDSIAKVGEGETLHFRLTLSPGQSVRLHGEVTYIYPGIGFGVRFVNLTKEEEILLRQIILKHGGQVPEPDRRALEQETKSGPAESLPDTPGNPFSQLTRSIQAALEDKGEKQ